MDTAEPTPIDVLDHHILTLCIRINAATYELLVMIREFDLWLVLRPNTQCTKDQSARTGSARS